MLHNSMTHCWGKVNICTNNEGHRNLSYRPVLCLLIVHRCISHWSVLMHIQVQAAFLAAAASNDVGVHTIIRHTDMRTFWRKFFNGLPKVIKAMQGRKQFIVHNAHSKVTTRSEKLHVKFENFWSYHTIVVFLS